jgi:hypothetical protein
MNTPEALNHLVVQLVRRGLPVDYAERAVAEFDDHHRDLLGELHAGGWSDSHAAAEATRRLGDSRTLIKKTAREYQRRHWCARWRLITFLFGPVPLLLLSWIALTLAMFCIVWPLERIGILPAIYDSGTLSAGQCLVMRLWFASLGFGVPAFTMLVLIRLARRAALNWKWVAVSACILGLAMGMLRCQFHPASLEFLTTFNKFRRFNHPTIALGIPFYSYPTWFHAWKWYTYDLQQICQVLLPMGVVAIMARRAKLLSQRASLMVASPANR